MHNQRFPYLLQKRDFMIAWWLRAVSLFNVVLLVVWCVWAWQRSPWLALAGVVFFICFGRIWLGMQFVIMQIYRQRLSLNRPTGAQVLAAWNAETKESARHFAWLMPWREWAVPDHLPVDCNGKQGVVLVHGWLCNRAVWTHTMKQLRAQNIPFVAVSLPMMLHPIETARPTVDAAVRRLHAATGVAPLLVAHSMGGLVVRDWLRSQSAEDAQSDWVPRDALTIGSPHRGSPLALCVTGPNATQMRPNSVWLRQLRSDEAQSGSAFSRMRWHCVFSDCDNVVFPESTSMLEPASQHLLAGYAHVQLLESPEVGALIRDLLIK